MVFLKCFINYWLLLLSYSRSHTISSSIYSVYVHDHGCQNSWQTTEVLIHCMLRLSVSQSRCCSHDRIQQSWTVFLTSTICPHWDQRSLIASRKDAFLRLHPAAVHSPINRFTFQPFRKIAFEAIMRNQKQDMVTWANQDSFKNPEARNRMKRTGNRFSSLMKPTAKLRRFLNISDLACWWRSDSSIPATGRQTSPQDHTTGMRCSGRWRFLLYVDRFAAQCRASGHRHR